MTHAMQRPLTGGHPSRDEWSPAKRLHGKQRLGVALVGPRGVPRYLGQGPLPAPEWWLLVPATRGVDQWRWRVAQGRTLYPIRDPPYAGKDLLRNMVGARKNKREQYTPSVAVIH